MYADNELEFLLSSVRRAKLCAGCRREHSRAR